MADGIRAVSALPIPVVATITLDSYTRVRDDHSARAAVARGDALNGFPIVAHGSAITAEVAAAAQNRIPIQVRHGSAAPAEIFATMVSAGLSASEGGPVSYCLPYGRTPLAESVSAWRDATTQLAERCARRGLRAHLETFGGCLMGQLCPPSLLIAMSVLECMFFVEHGVRSVSLTYAQQTHPIQDIEALAALRTLAGELLPASVDRHLVLYTYMGVYPRTGPGAARMLDLSAEIAVRGGADRLIVKTVAEAHRIPGVADNIDALLRASGRARWAARRSPLPTGDRVDPSEILSEARYLIDSVLGGGEIGADLLTAFRDGRLDVPYCLHADNRGLTQGVVRNDGRLDWAQTGRLALPSRMRSPRRVRSMELLSMLNFVSAAYDGYLPARPGAAEELRGPQPYRIGIIGAGPRGLSVLERLAARISAGELEGRPAEIFVIDPVSHGSGRIWRPDQSPLLLMNTPADEVTMFSGPRDGGPDRPGAGRSLGEWWRAEEGDAAGEYAPRALYGRYLEYVLEVIAGSLPAGMYLRLVSGEAVRLDPEPGYDEWTITLSDGREIDVDRVVLATGHPAAMPSALADKLGGLAREHPNVVFLPGDSAADLPLERIEAGSTAGVIGLGLAFYDVVALLTAGRGGRFIEDDKGELRYLASGREPFIVGGSRSGVPLPARGRNQKTADYRYEARLFTRSRVEQARARGKLTFRDDVLPPLMAEVNLAYFETWIRRWIGAATAEAFTAEAIHAARPARRPDTEVAAVAARYCGAPPLDLEQLARPFRGRVFTDRAHYQRTVLDHIRADIEQAELGNVEGPLKAALDIIRDVRSTIRVAVDYGGLTARSHELEFLGDFVPVAGNLTAGPPGVRLRQVSALMRAGVLEFAGPDVRFDIDAERGCYTVRSPQVAGAPIALDAIIDARIPSTDIRRDRSVLTAYLRGAGTISAWCNTDGAQIYETGGTAVTTRPFHPIDSYGRTVPGMHVIGIPIEHTRWFTQVGSGRPGPWGDFAADADSIASSLIAAARVGDALLAG